MGFAAPVCTHEVTWYHVFTTHAIMWLVVAIMWHVAVTVALEPSDLVWVEMGAVRPTQSTNWAI